MQIPPQMMFLHQGQNQIKELRFHPQYACLLTTTAEDSFNVFRPNLEPMENEEEDNAEMDDDVLQQATSTEETKHESSAAEESKR